MLKWTLDDTEVFVNTEVYTIKQFKTTKYYREDEWVQNIVGENNFKTVVITQIETEEVVQFIGKNSVFSYVYEDWHKKYWTRTK